MLLLSWSVGSAFPDEGKTASYYIFPIMPNQVNYLAGTMGELRASHFHAGIDIKTGGREGLEVYAAADGYVSRIKVSTNGYGNALYLQHPNGETTVYAHLLQYNEEIAAYVRRLQYKNRSFAVDLNVAKGTFPVKQGDVIALSGNTGGSSGPHLHFEIRDKYQQPVNPLKYSFSEIRDNIAPIAQKIALVCMDSRARINGKYGRFEFSVTRRGNEFDVTGLIQAYGNIGVELLGHDKLNGASNRNGIPYVTMSLDGQKKYEQNLNTFSFAESRNILVHMNFQVRKMTGRAYNKMYIAGGDKLRFYDRSLGNGVLSIADDSTHYVRIDMKDAYGNESCVNLRLKGDPINYSLIPSYSRPSRIPGEYSFKPKTLVVYKDLTQDPSELIELYQGVNRHISIPAYYLENTAVYLWDTERGIPDSIDFCYKNVVINHNMTIPPNYNFNYYHRKADIYFPRDALFDTLQLSLHYEVEDGSKKEVFTLYPFYTPLRKNVSITLKPDGEYSDKKRTHVYGNNRRNSFVFKGGTWSGNAVSFKSRDFGRFTLLTDTLPPQIRVVRFNSDMTSFIIKDDLSGIKSINAYIDDQWVLMNYEYKKNLIWSEKLDNAIPFSGKFKLVIEDNAGNINTYTKTITP